MDAPEIPLFRISLAPWAGARAAPRAGAGARWLTLPFILSGRAALALMIAGAALLRAWLLAANYPLHHDEALYGYWAQLIVSGRDPLLLTAWVDKPPLALYAWAAALRLFGVSELALRLPGVIVSLATIICVYGLARRLYDARTALLASLLLALAPFAILFAPTAFTDPWLTLWLVAAVWAAVARRSFWAGLALGLAVASKQQGVLGVPLVAALLLAGDALGLRKETILRQNQHPERNPASLAGRSRRMRLLKLGRFCLALLGFALVFLPVTYWDSLRWATRPSFWDRSLTTYGGLGLAPLAAWPERAAEWARVAGYLFGLPVLSALMLGLAGFAALRNRRGVKAGVLLGVFLLGYGGVHLALTFQPWDRYLLPILPFVCVLAARGITMIFGPVARLKSLLRTAERLKSLQRTEALVVTVSVVRRALAIGLAVLLGWAAWLGATAQLPVGSDHGAYTGLDRIAAFLRGQDADAVIYQRWIGWHLDFYLFDAPQERRWWGAGWKLAGDAARTYREKPGRAQWVVLPGWRDAAAGEVRLALASRGLALAEALRVYRADGSRAFTVYRVIPDDATVAPRASTGAGRPAEEPGDG